MSETFLFWGLCAVWGLIASFVLWIVLRLGRLQRRLEGLEQALGSDRASG